MNVVPIQGAAGTAKILIGERLENLKTYLPGDRPIIITDGNVRRLYGALLPDAPIIEIGTGERVKTLDTVRYIYEKLVDLEADRSSFVLGIGGGIVCDIAGFAASTYMRGLRFGFVATTLLSQVDAAVGGKNGVNLAGYKNLVGVFRQPEFVLCDPVLLHTLPEKEIRCGLAEVVKHAAIGDTALFSFLEDHGREVLQRDTGVMERLVSDSVRIKSSIVNRDETEKGERRKLNFGHTLGHVIERMTGMSHGEAVGVGMAAASALSVRKGYLSAEEAVRFETLLEGLRLPTRIRIDGESVLDTLKKDKKRKEERIHFVFLQGIGTATVEALPITDVASMVCEWMGHPAS